MKARVYVTMKPSVLDPQGQTICSALRGLGHPKLASVRQGKVLRDWLRGGPQQGRRQIALETIAHDVLANPVIEEYRSNCSTSICALSEAQLCVELSGTSAAAKRCR